MKTRIAGILSAGVLSLTALFGSASAADKGPAYLEKGQTRADLCVHNTLKEMAHNHFQGSAIDRMPPSMQYKHRQTPYIVSGDTLENIKNSCVKHYKDSKAADFSWSGDSGNLSYYKDKTSIQISDEDISLLPG